MEKREAVLVAQLLKTLSDLLLQLDKAYETRDAERFEMLKREIMKMQKLIDTHL